MTCLMLDKFVISDLMIVIDVIDLSCNEWPVKSLLQRCGKLQLLEYKWGKSTDQSRIVILKRSL